MSSAEITQGRNLEMTTLYRAGLTLQEIGSKFGVSRARVHQIIRRHGLTVADGWMGMTAPQWASEKVAETRAKRAARERVCRARWGFGLDEYRAHVAEFGGWRQADSPMKCYSHQRHNAAYRGIAWNFTFADWWRVWRESGKWGERGRGGYVMARWGDGGTPYSADTVYICTQSQNAKDSFIAVPAAARAAKRAAKT